MSDGYKRTAAIVASLFGPPMSSGRWYLPFDHAGLTTAAVSTNSRLYAIPICFGKACTINGVAVDITAAGESGSLVRLGLYADNGGVPGALVSDFGTVAANAIAVPTLTPSLAVAAGFYWQAVVAQSAPTTRPTCRVIQQGVGARVALTNPGTAASCGAYFRDGVTAALSALSTFIIDGVVSIATVPAVWMKAA